MSGRAEAPHQRGKDVPLEGQAEGLDLRALRLASASTPTVSDFLAAPKLSFRLG